MFLQTTGTFKADVQQLWHITLNALLADFQEVEGDAGGVITAIEAAKHLTAVWATQGIFIRTAVDV